MTRQLLVAGCLGATLCAMLATGLSQPAHAEAFTLAGKTFASLEAFLVGSWTWLRTEPAQIVHMRFGRDKSFFFNNETIQLTHTGRYKGTAKGMELVIARTCDAKRCANREPPLVHNYDLQPETPNRFRAGNEEWNRDP